MKHLKLFVATIVVMALILPSTWVAAASADFTQKMAMDDAASSTAVWKQEKALPDIQSQYTTALANAPDIDTEKVEFKNPMTGLKQSIYFDNRTQILLQLQKYIMPAQLGLAYTSTRDGITLTKRSMEAAALELYLGMLSAQQNIAVSTYKLEIAQKALKRSEDLLSVGKSTVQARDVAKWQADKAASNLQKDQLSFLNIKRTYASTMGKDQNAEIGKIVPTFGGVIPKQDVEAYIKTALEKRMEITSLREKIRIRDLEIGVYQYRDMHIINADTKRDYERALLAQEQDKAKLALAIVDIENEIRAAYLKIQKDQLSLQMTENTLNRQKAQLVKLQALVTAGRLTEASTYEMKAAVMQLENGVLLSRVALDNAYRKFRNASNIGPSFSTSVGMP